MRAKADMQVAVRRRCELCGGTGIEKVEMANFEHAVSVQCDECNGTGWVESWMNFEDFRMCLHIPFPSGGALA